MMEPESLARSPKYRAWKKALEEAGCVLQNVESLRELGKRDGSLLFALLRVSGRDPEDRPLPAYALIKGHACLVVTVVVNGDSGERKFLMLRQRRIAHGGESLEFPAGMLDDEVDDPAGAAMREMREETGLEIRREDLVPLAAGPLFSSPGLEDEALHFFACTLTLPSEKFQALEGGRGGNAEEGEFIRLGLWDYADALREVTSAQVRLGFYLYFESMNRGTIQG